MQEGLKKAVGVPLSLAQQVNLLWPCLKEMVLHGNVACKSDLQVYLISLQHIKKLLSMYNASALCLLDFCHHNETTWCNIMSFAFVLRCTDASYLGQHDWH